VFVSAPAGRAEAREAEEHQAPIEASGTADPGTAKNCRTPVIESTIVGQIAMTC
jgi:hypothetical protein